jgi:hypothetical protein
MQMDPQLMAQKKKMQMEAMLKDSEMKKNERDMVQAEIFLRDLKRKQAQLQSEFLAKEIQLKKLASEHVQLQAELIKLKHQMNNLGR